MIGQNRLIGSADSFGGGVQRPQRRPGAGVEDGEVEFYEELIDRFRESITSQPSLLSKRTANSLSNRSPQEELIDLHMDVQEIEKQFKQCLDIATFLVKKNKDLDSEIKTLHEDATNRVDLTLTKSMGSNSSTLNLKTQMQELEWRLQSEQEASKSLRERCTDLEDQLEAKLLSERELKHQVGQLEIESKKYESNGRGIGELNESGEFLSGPAGALKKNIRAKVESEMQGRLEEMKLMLTEQEQRCENLDSLLDQRNQEFTDMQKKNDKLMNDVKVLMGEKVVNNKKIKFYKEKNDAKTDLIVELEKVIQQLGERIQRDQEAVKIIQQEQVANELQLQSLAQSSGSVLRNRGGGELREDLFNTSNVDSQNSHSNRSSIISQQNNQSANQSFAQLSNNVPMAPLIQVSPRFSSQATSNSISFVEANKTATNQIADGGLESHNTSQVVMIEAPAVNDSKSEEHFEGLTPPKQRENELGDGVLGGEKNYDSIINEAQTQNCQGQKNGQSNSIEKQQQLMMQDGDEINMLSGEVNSGLMGGDQMVDYEHQEEEIISGEAYGIMQSSMVSVDENPHLGQNVEGAVEEGNDLLDDPQLLQTSFGEEENQQLLLLDIEEVQDDKSEQVIDTVQKPFMQESQADLNSDRDQILDKSPLQNETEKEVVIPLKTDPQSGKENEQDQSDRDGQEMHEFQKVLKSLKKTSPLEIQTTDDDIIDKYRLAQKEESQKVDEKVITLDHDKQKEQNLEKLNENLEEIKQIQDKNELNQGNQNQNLFKKEDILTGSDLVESNQSSSLFLPENEETDAQVEIQDCTYGKLQSTNNPSISQQKQFQSFKVDESAQNSNFQPNIVKNDSQNKVETVYKIENKQQIVKEEMPTNKILDKMQSKEQDKSQNMNQNFATIDRPQQVVGSVAAPAAWTHTKIDIENYQNEKQRSGSLQTLGILGLTDVAYSLDKITSAYQKVDKQSFVMDNNEESMAVFKYDEAALAVADEEKLISNEHPPLDLKNKVQKVQITQESQANNRVYQSIDSSHNSPDLTQNIQKANGQSLLPSQPSTTMLQLQRQKSSDQKSSEPLKAIIEQEDGSSDQGTSVTSSQNRQNGGHRLSNGNNSGNNHNNSNNLGQGNQTASSLPSSNSEEALQRAFETANKERDIHEVQIEFASEHDLESPDLIFDRSRSPMTNDSSSPNKPGSSEGKNNKSGGKGMTMSMMRRSQRNQANGTRKEPEREFFEMTVLAFQLRHSSISINIMKADRSELYEECMHSKEPFQNWPQWIETRCMRILLNEVYNSKKNKQRNTTNTLRQSMQIQQVLSKSSKSMVKSKLIQSGRLTTTQAASQNVENVTRIPAQGAGTLGSTQGGKLIRAPAAANSGQISDRFDYGATSDVVDESPEFDLPVRSQTQQQKTARNDNIDLRVRQISERATQRAIQDQQATATVFLQFSVKDNYFKK